VRSIVAAVALALCVIVKPAVAGGDKESDADKDWSGWWLIYHRNSDGRLVPDKFAVAMVINDKPSPSWNFKSTGQWIARVFSPRNGIAKTLSRTAAISLSRNPRVCQVASTVRGDKRGATHNSARRE
jgi:hypothetical protein